MMMKATMLMMTLIVTLLDPINGTYEFGLTTMSCTSTARIYFISLSIGSLGGPKARMIVIQKWSNSIVFLKP